MKKLFFGFFLFSLFTISNADDNTRPFLDIEAMKANAFIEQNPEYDGRGALIFILDCGVDPAVIGLKTTSTGKVKVIDIQDFSGQLVLSLSKATRDTLNGRPVLSDGNDIKVEGVDALELKPADGEYYLGKIDEENSYKNSVVKDINSNGKKNDVFPVLVFKINNGSEVLKDSPGLVKVPDDIWVYYIDQDSDGSFDDEKPMFDYKYRFDTFNFYQGEAEVRPLMTFSANVGEGPKLIVNTCDGSHGSHCAGMAAGCNIYGDGKNDGVAPGAYVVSLKIGDNSLSGGATTCGSMKKAYEYGVEFMKEAGFENAVFSMSYGIGSESPGKTVMDKFFEDFTKKHTEIIVCKSQGNAGPGINSTGNPSGNDGVLSVGAMIPPSTLKNLYGSQRQKHWVTNFSSRSAETAKPDVIAPGAASSTVPAFSRGDAFWGTSMSTPEAAGACALLLSAAKKDNLKTDGFMIKKALKYSARPVEGYTAIDYGNGLIDIPKAYEYLKILAKRKEYDKVLYFKVSTQNSFYPDKRGTAAFWKAGGYFPNNGERQNVSVRAVFPDDMPKQDKENFYRVFKLRSNSRWLKTDKSEIYIRGSIPQNFNLIYDDKMLKEPGIYTGRITAYTENEDNGGFADFDVMATVVIPYKADSRNDYALHFKNEKLEAGDIKRIFAELPPSATGMNISLKPADNGSFAMGLYLYGPDGKEIDFRSSGSNPDKKPLVIQVDEGQLQYGTWEIIPACDFKATFSSRYNLDVRYYGIESDPAQVEELNIPVGDKPKGEISLFNHFETVTALLNGSIEGYLRNDTHSITNTKVFTKSINIGEEIQDMEILIDMEISEFDKMTDVAINIKDKTGKVVYSTGLERKSEIIYFDPPDSGEYTLEIVPGFANAAEMAKGWEFSLIEKYYYDKEIDLSLSPSSIKLISGLWSKVRFELEGQLPMPPDECNIFGNIELRDDDYGDLIKKIEIELE